MRRGQDRRFIVVGEYLDRDNECWYVEDNRDPVFPVVLAKCGRRRWWAYRIAKLLNEDTEGV